MREDIRRLCSILFFPELPSDSFLESLQRYTRPIPPFPLQIEAILRERSPPAFSLYSRLIQSTAISSLVYVFLALSIEKRDVIESARSNIKRCALGLSVPYLNPVELILIKGRLDSKTYNILYQIYTNSLNYKRLKMASSSHCSMTQRYYLEEQEYLIKEYEERVRSADYDFLLFYNHMQSIYIPLQASILGNDIICDKTYYKNGLLYDNDSESHPSIIKAVYRFVNECTRDYFIMGSFNDPYDEYFIKEHTVILGRIPYGITTTMANQIAYIGRYTCLLRSIQVFEVDPQVIAEINTLDLSVKSSKNRLLDHIVWINQQIQRNFINRYKIFHLLDYIHDTFLFRRGDFIEHFFKSLKEIRRASRNNLLSILEDSLSYAFPGSEFNQIIDIFVKSPRESHQEAGSFTDGFSLFCHIEYPVSVLIDEEFVLKLACIFKFLWKLKKVDILSRKVGDLCYLNLLQRVLFYMYNEVIATFGKIKWNERELAMDNLHSDLHKTLDNIMKRLFINTPGKKIEFFLFHLEKCLVAAGKGGSMDDSEVQRALKEFYGYVNKDIFNTALWDIHLFIKR